MSADTLSELRKALEQEREARKQAEAERYAAQCEASEAQLEAEALRTRSEQAEKERDEARRIHAANVEAGIALATEFNRASVGYAVDGVFVRARALLALFGAEKAARERAEADNAALLDDSRTGLMFWHGNACSMASGAYPIDPGECFDAVCREWMARIRSAHPGAALLEHVRVLDAVLEVAREMDAGDSSTDAWARLHDACVAVDALKETR